MNFDTYVLGKIKTKMKSLIAVMAICLINKQTDAWGGLFNRFSPEMLDNMGYGSHGGYMVRVFSIFCS